MMLRAKIDCISFRLKHVQHTKQVAASPQIECSTSIDSRNRTESRAINGHNDVNNTHLQLVYSPEIAYGVEKRFEHKTLPS